MFIVLFDCIKYWQVCQTVDIFYNSDYNNGIITTFFIIFYLLQRRDSFLGELAISFFYFSTKDLLTIGFGNVRVEYARKSGGGNMWTIKDLAQYLKVDYTTIYDRVIAKKIKAVKFGCQWRIPEEEIERLKKEGF